MKVHNALLQPIYAATAAYYSARAAEFGATPFGADWTCAATQEMRFVQLLRICDSVESFSLNDLGCGYGALLSFLHREHAGSRVNYLGVDISGQMLRLARRQHSGTPAARFVTGPAIPRVADYSVASGIFNVCLDQPKGRWETLIAVTLAELARTSRRGFAVNFHRAPGPGIYSSAPGQWAEYCTDHLGTEVSVLDSYGLPEFTLLARRAS